MLLLIQFTTEHVYQLYYIHYRRGKDYSRPVGFVSAGVTGGSKGGEEEGGSESEEEVRNISGIT